MAAAAGGQGQLTMLQLYRHILKAAKQFPSIKKHSIIQQVKTEFRDNRVRGQRGDRVIPPCAPPPTPTHVCCLPPAAL
jgi:hypothetical protein